MAINNGGLIIIAQIENEHASYSTETTYMDFLRDIFATTFEVILCTHYGGYESDALNG
jgi:hypothetical protein